MHTNLFQIAIVIPIALWSSIFHLNIIHYPSTKSLKFMAFYIIFCIIAIPTS